MSAVAYEDWGSAVTDLILRTARATDADAIARIYAHHVKHGTASFDAVPRTPEQTDHKIADTLSKGWPFLVAERDGTIMGYAYVTAFRDRPGQRTQNCFPAQAARLPRSRCTIRWDSPTPGACATSDANLAAGLTASTCRRNLVMETGRRLCGSQPDRLRRPCAAVARKGERKYG